MEYVPAVLQTMQKLVHVLLRSTCVLSLGRYAVYWPCFREASVHKIYRPGYFCVQRRRLSASVSNRRALCSNMLDMAVASACLECDVRLQTRSIIRFVNVYSRDTQVRSINMQSELGGTSMGSLSTPALDVYSIIQAESEHVDGLLDNGISFSSSRGHAELYDVWISQSGSKNSRDQPSLRHLLRPIPGFSLTEETLSATISAWHQQLQR